MIKVQDWVASIPDEEKHIAYVGEGKCINKEFLLCGDGWERYKDWSFFLDMAFDLESITTRDSRQVVSTRINRSEIDEATGVTADETIFKETYTVYDEDVLGYDKTDIAPLTKHVEKDGIHLIWTVLRQQTVLPGKLWATLRAASGEYDEIKKSDILVFEVDAAVCAVPATVPAVSVMEQMCQQAAEAKDAAVAAKEFAESAATGANRAAADALNAQFVTENYAELTKERWQETVTNAAAAQQAQEKAAAYARAADQSQNVAAEHNNAVAEYAQEVKTVRDEVAQLRGEASQCANGATQAYRQAQEAAEAAAASATAAEEAAQRNKALIVTTELVQDGTAYDLKSTHAASEIYEHLQNGGTAVLDWMDGECLTLSSCTEEAAVFSAVTKNGKDARATIVTIDNDKGWSQSGATLGGGGTAEYNRVNVRDYGAVGDGVTDDRGAIIRAFNAAKRQLPCEVYFPAGTYGILSGITIEMEYGTGGLRVCGAGRDVTTIKYLDDYTSQQGWYAIRIWPVGRPDTIPDEEDYLHDISYIGLTVYDPDPIGHALSERKGDSVTEETHGFDIHCCKGVSVTDCQFITVGDEAIDICFCHDVVVMNNRLVGSPAAGAGGGAIAIGDGCKGVVVSGNTINGSAPDEVLDDGTVLTKSNAGIVVETPSGYPVQDVTIVGNTIRNVHGKGIILSAETAGASLTNAIAADNIISGCDIGILVSGAQIKDNIKITNNVIADCVGYAIEARSDVGNITICGNTIRNIKGNYAIRTPISTSRQFIADNVFENIEYGGVYCSGDVVLKDCVFNGLGTAETAPTNDTYGVHKYGGTLTVSGCVFKDVRMSTLKRCLQNPDYIDNTDVEVVNKNTGVVDGGGSSIAGSAVKRIVNCSLTGGFSISQDNAIVQGTKIVANAASSHIILVSANRVSIVGCIIQNNASSGSYRAINETSGYNYNLFANNIVNRAITTTGAQSVAVNNIDTRVTA